MSDNAPPQEGYTSDVTVRLRDLELKHRLLRERTLLIGENLVEERDATFNEVQELKKMVLKLTYQNKQMQDFIQRLSEQVAGLARKEEIMMLQRQFDLLQGDA